LGSDELGRTSRSEDRPDSPLADAIASTGISVLPDPSGRTATPQGDAAEAEPQELTVERVIEAVLAEIPHVLPFETRVILLHRVILADHEKRAASRGPWAQAPTQKQQIRRDKLVEDAFEAFERLTVEGRLRDVFRVEFVAEDGTIESGVDGGGLFKEFMIHICRTLFDPGFGLFSATPEQTLVPSFEAFGVLGRTASELYTFLGRVVGKAIYEMLLLEPQFCRCFLNRLLGRVNTVDDVAALDQELYRNLLSLRDEATVEELGLTFCLVMRETGGDYREHDLIPNGSRVPVTKANLTRYIHLLANFKSNVQLDRQSVAFRHGLQSVLPTSWLRMFDPYELNMLISGSDVGFDVDDLRSNTGYGGGYEEDSPVVLWLWELLRDHLEPGDVGRFLMFATSCSRAPLLGFVNLHPRFCIHRVPDSERLPTASTCANLLKLPDYTSFSLMRAKVLQAIRAEAGFDLS